MFQIEFSYLKINELSNATRILSEEQSKCKMLARAAAQTVQYSGRPQYEWVAYRHASVVQRE